MMGIKKDFDDKDGNCCAKEVPVATNNQNNHSLILQEYFMIRLLKLNVAIGDIAA